MTTTNHHPVDSTFYPCCGAIGRHAASCGAENLSDGAARLEGIPLPAGATAVTNWLDWDGKGTVARGFTGSIRGERVQVETFGVQYADGHIAHMSLAVRSRINKGAPGSIYASEARELAAHLLAAADELDALEAGR